MSINGAKEVAQLAFGPKARSAPKGIFLKEVFFNSSELHRNMTQVLVTARMMKPSLKTIKKGWTNHISGQWEIGWLSG